jgi:hypothetical protein
MRLIKSLVVAANQASNNFARLRAARTLPRRFSINYRPLSACLWPLADYAERGPRNKSLLTTKNFPPTEITFVLGRQFSASSLSLGSFCHDLLFGAATVNRDNTLSPSSWQRMGNLHGTRCFSAAFCSICGYCDCCGINRKCSESTVTVTVTNPKGVIG